MANPKRDAREIAEQVKAVTGRYPNVFDAGSGLFDIYPLTETEWPIVRARLSESFATDNIGDLSRDALWIQL